MLLDVAELLEPAVAVGTFVGFLSGMNPDVLDQLMVAAERLEALLALVRLDLRPSGQLARVHLHRRLMHKNLQREKCIRKSGRKKIKTEKKKNETDFRSLRNKT